MEGKQIKRSWSLSAAVRYEPEPGRPVVLRKGFLRRSWGRRFLGEQGAIRSFAMAGIDACQGWLGVLYINRQSPYETQPPPRNRPPTRPYAPLDYNHCGISRFSFLGAMFIDSYALFCLFNTKIPLRQARPDCRSVALLACESSIMGPCPPNGHRLGRLNRNSHIKNPNAPKL